MKTVQTLLIFFIFALSLLLRAAEPTPESFIVNRHPPAPGKRTTPYLRYQVDAAWRQDDLRRAAWSVIKSETEVLQLQRTMRERLLENIGGLPGEKTPLNAQITGTIQMDGYRIEKLIFESLPGFHVTALLYLPDGPALPRPAVLVACGHSPIGKAHTGYQQIGARLAKRGYVTLCWDPVGQGERSQCWDRANGKSRYNRVCGEHAILGNLAYLAGANLARWEVWDGIRAHDYLLTRPEVDGTRISITGTSGGGFQCSHIAALDPRIKVSLPSCYISALPMRMNNRIFRDPDSDPEQDIYRMVSSGVGHPGLLFMVYPRPQIVSAAVEDFFPIEGTRKTFREMAGIYRTFGIPERIALTEGYHRHSYSNYNQQAAYAFLDRFSGMPVREGLDSVKVLEEKKLRCTGSGQVLVDIDGSRSLFEVIREYYLKRKGRPGPSLDELYRGPYYPGIGNWPVVPDKGQRPLTEIAWKKTGSATHNGITIDRYRLRHSGLLSIPLLHIYSQGRAHEKTLFWFNEESSKARVSDFAQLKRYLKQGYGVVSFDCRALGENRLHYQVESIDDPALARVAFDKQYKSSLSGVLANYVYNSLLAGRPYFLQLIEDSEIAARFAREVLGSEKIQVAAGGEAYTLAASIADALPGISLLPGKDEEGLLIRWSEIVEQMQEIWPVQYLLPGGAYIK